MDNLKDSIVFGGLYEVKHERWNNDQSYHLAIPITDNDGNIWMQDTYQLSRPNTRVDSNLTDTEIAIQNYSNYDKPKYSNVLLNTYNYYYRNQEKLESLDKFQTDYTLIGDLTQYRSLKSVEDYKDYLHKDLLFYVKLWFEHGYSMNRGSIGVILVKKNAKPQLPLKFKNQVNECYKSFTFPRGIYKSDFDKLNQMYDEMIEQGVHLDPKVVNKYNQCFYLQGRLLGMEAELEKFFKDFKYRFDFDFLSSRIKLQDVPNVKEYLENRCYCTYEVYDICDSIYCALFKPDYPCKIIQKSNDRILLISSDPKNSDIDTVKLLFIQYKDGQGLNSNSPYVQYIRSVTPTLNNFKIMIDYVSGKLSDIRSQLDIYFEDEFFYDEDLNNLINAYEEVPL